MSTSNLSYTFLNQNSGQTYSYIVKACHNQYEGPNGASTSVSIPICSTPSNIQSSFDTSGNIIISWSYPQTQIIIHNFAIFDNTNNGFSPLIPANPSNANYFFNMGNSYPLGLLIHFL